MLKTDKIYVAGHLGLVGSAIWNNLKTKGYNNLIGKSIKELNLIDNSEVESFFSIEKPEIVFLAAAKVGGIVANNTYRAQFIYENLMIQNNVIHNAYKHGVKKLLFLGSTCIYPRNATQPMKEEYLLTSPLEYTNEPYAVAKIAGIKMCESYNIQYNTNYIAVMPTNLYGPNDNFDLSSSHVMPALIRKIFLAKLLQENKVQEVIKNLKVNNFTEAQNILSKYGVSAESVEIWGTGNPLREFLWSEEMADACVYIMEKVNFSDVSNKAQEIKNTHINIGTGKEISIGNLAKLIQKTLQYKGKLIFNSSKPDGTPRKLTDVSKLHNLGWQHKIEIEEGVKKLCDWYQQSSNINR